MFKLMLGELVNALIKTCGFSVVILVPEWVRISELYIYWNDNCGSNFEANMAEIEARLVGMIQAPARKFTQFRMKNFKNRHSFFGKSFLFFFLLCVKSGFITPPGN